MHTNQILLGMPYCKIKKYPTYSIQQLKQVEQLEMLARDRYMHIDVKTTRSATSLHRRGIINRGGKLCRECEASDDIYKDSR
jgi:hypothetical protein